jgi:hypothetical protein
MPFTCRLSEITDHALSLVDLTPESLDLTPLDYSFERKIFNLGEKGPRATDLVNLIYLIQMLTRSKPIHLKLPP